MRRETCINCLGVTAIPIAIVIFEICAEVIKTLAMSSTEHEHSEVFIANSRDQNAHSTSVEFIALAICTAVASTLILAKRKVGTTPTTPTPPIDFKGFNMVEEVSVVGVIVHAIFLIVGELSFVGGGRRQ